MATDLEAMLKLMLRSKQDPKLAASLEKLGALLDSPDGEVLARAKAAGGADTLKAASEAMLRGDRAAAKEKIEKLIKEIDKCISLLEN